VCAKIEYAGTGIRILKNRMRVRYAYSVFEDLHPVALKYYIIKLPTASH